MPTVFGYHDVKDKDHWLASPMREEFFGPLGVTNIRTFVDPTNPTRVGLLWTWPTWMWSCPRWRPRRPPRRGP